MLARDAAQAALDDAQSNSTCIAQTSPVPSNLTDLYQHVYGVTDSSGSIPHDPRCEESGPINRRVGPQLPSLKLPELNP